MEQFFPAPAPTSGDFSELSDRVNANSAGTVKTLATGETYLCPSDGFVYIINDANQYGYVSIYAADGATVLGTLRPETTIASNNSHATCFVKKGMYLKTGTSAYNSCKFTPMT